MKKIIHPLLLFLFIGVILSLSVRGLDGVPSSRDLLIPKWQSNGPFELSPERGRFALTYSIVEDHSLQFSEDIGRFTTPDVAISKGRFVSLFAPLLSFVAIPGYVIGKYFGISQVGSFAIVSLFALINVFLLRSISIKLGAQSLAATIGSLLFIFATPAFAYGVNLYQHHVSTFLMLLSLYAVLRFGSIISLLVVFFAFASAITLDYPNLFFILPIAIYAFFFKTIYLEKTEDKAILKVNVLKILTPFIMIIPIFFFFWFNQTSYGNPFQLSGTLPTNKSVSNIEKLSGEEIAFQAEKRYQESRRSGRTKSALGFFNTRPLLNGFYIHFFSPDRGVIYYAPVILFGIIGFLLAFKNKVKMVPLLFAIVGANVLLYSMWGDPWGGWAFGSRYLIPSYAILSIFIALLLTYWRKKVWFLVIFILVAFYSIAVNTLGAITTSAIPPQVEVLNLEKLSGAVQKYTIERNWDFLVAGKSKSFIYQTFLKDYLSPLQFYQILTVSLFLVVGGILVYYIYTSEKKGKDNV